MRAPADFSAIGGYLQGRGRFGMLVGLLLMLQIEAGASMNLGLVHDMTAVVTYATA